MAPHNTLHQDLSSADSIAHLPDRTDTRLAVDWIPPLPPPLLGPSHRTAPSQTTAVSRGEAKATSSLGSWVLRGDRRHRRRSHWSLDAVVSGQQRPVAVGRFLASGGEAQMDKAAAADVLGHSGEHQRGWMEPTTCAVEAVPSSVDVEHGRRRGWDSTCIDRRRSAERDHERREHQRLQPPACTQSRNCWFARIKLCEFAELAKPV